MSKLKWNLLSAEHYFSLKKVAAGSTSCKQALEQKMSGERIKEISERERERTRKNRHDFPLT